MASPSVARDRKITDAKSSCSELERRMLMMSLVGCATCPGGCASMQVPMQIARKRRKLTQMLESLMAMEEGQDRDLYK
jgi:hypothetical protein